MGIRLALNPWNQVFTWPEARSLALMSEELGYDELWTWEHVLACMGAPDQDTFDAYTLLTAWSQVTSRVRLGVLVTANTFHNPAMLAKTVATLDHVSGGRADLGLGAGWLEVEHRAFGFPFGAGAGERLGWLDEAAGAIRGLLDGETVTSPEGGRYDLDGASLLPRPLQERLPILIGGAGERKTLRTVARYADRWNWVAHPDPGRMRHKDEVLRRHCEEVGRDHSEIERTAFLSPVIRDTEDEAMEFFRVQMDANRLPASAPDDVDIYVTSVDRMIDRMIEWRDLGFTTFFIQSAAPIDHETIERFAREIRPAVDAA
jgi:alkanesulfonate monooxygenase SsuD/methylene tetrahydromethanopterin reductase-like flavin-dependent oxidoreductase (luciferase family)